MLGGGLRAKGREHRVKGLLVITITAAPGSWSVDYKGLKAQAKRYEELLENSGNSNN